MMNRKYDQQMEGLKRSLAAAREREQLNYDTGMLRADVKAHIARLANQERDEVFFRGILDGLTVHPDRHAELRLDFLPKKWRFVVDSLENIRQKMDREGCFFDPAVPTSVSKAPRGGKLPEKVTDFGVFVKEGEDSEIPGYLFSRRKSKSEEGHPE